MGGWLQEWLGIAAVLGAFVQGATRCLWSPDTSPTLFRGEYADLLELDGLPYSPSFLTSA